MKKGKLETKDVLHLANLAKLQLTDEEIKKITPQLSETLEYMENLSQVRTEDGRRNTEDGIQKTKELREDRVESDRLLVVEEALGNSKKRKGNYFGVKRIL